MITSSKLLGIFLSHKLTPPAPRVWDTAVRQLQAGLRPDPCSKFPKQNTNGVESMALGIVSEALKIAELIISKPDECLAKWLEIR